MAFFTEFYLNLRAALRLFKFVYVISMYFVRAIILSSKYHDPVERRKKLTENGSRTGRDIIKAFNVELICKEPLPPDEHCMLVGNHIGFIDIVCLNALTSSVFITSLEMKNTPVLGQIADLGGCAYVNRKSRMSIQDEL
ncbi:MAG: 1-acyl-sn-glycerol-3-phosphate acyltransferase, partial [Pseudobdellovibrio sp.]